MFLKRIELQGFKSFANKVEVELKGGITGVVGPNGSGKSNISDAIRWVLGEQSAKTLRGSKMEDVIFSGTEQRKPLGFAEITLVLDNKDKMLNVDFSEVSVTRRVFRSGDSEYYINKTACRLKDIRELFMDTGVGKDGYSIIGQGKIDEILSTKSEDRRNLFEEAAGIVKYKTRKEEAEKKLEKTKDNILRINDIISELEMQIDPLKEQSDKAKKFNILAEQLKDLEINLFIREIDRLKEQVAHLDNQKELIDNQLKYNESKRDELEEKYSKAKSEIEDMDSSIEEIQNLKFTTQNQVEKNQGEIKLYNEKNNTIEKEMIRLKGEIEDFRAKIDKLKTEKEKLASHKEEVSRKIDTFEEKIEAKNNELEQLNIKIENEEKIIEAKKSDVIEIFNLIADKKSRINSIASFNQNIEKRVKQIQDETQQLKSSKEKNKKIVENIDNEIVEIKQKINECKELKQKYNKNKKDKESLFKNIVSQINNLSGEIQGKKSNYKLLKDMKSEYEGFYSSVKNALFASKRDNRLGKGVRGVVAELLQVEKKFERAIEVALGSSIQNIVTDTPEGAKLIIEHLKRNKLGRVTFLPLSSIKGRQLNQSEVSLLGLEGVLGVASKLIKFDNSYANIFSNLLGRTLIVENIEKGIKVSKMCKHSLKIVSLDGDVMNPGGSMTGGSFRGNNTNLLGRERQIKELESSILELQDKLSIMQNQEKKLNNEIKDFDLNLVSIDRNINDLNVSLATNENKRTQSKDEIIKLEGLIEKYDNENVKLNLDSEESRNEIIQITKEIEELKSKNELAQINIEDKTRYFEKERELKNHIVEEITSIRVSAASYKQENISIEESIKKLLDEEMDITNKINEKENEYSISSEELDRTKIRFNELKEAKNKLNSISIEYDTKLKQLKDNRNNFMQTFYSEQEKLKEMNRKINDLQKSLNTIDSKTAKYNVQLDNFNNKLWDEYDMSYQMALNYKKEIDSITRVQNEIRSLKNQIRQLGNVNLGSTEEYIRVKERFTFMQEQKEDLIEAKESLKHVIIDLEMKMEQQFIENFEIIKEHFQDVFNKLFKGGKADIYLIDSESILTSGIEIVAQPPGKKLQSLSLLSGGERALTAIALLFAILKTKPTPFCVLDEIEAALDDANVYRFADYLREFAKDTQFIVITHRKGTMECVDSLYGVTMQEKGVSNLISVKLTDKLIEKVG